jgi:outer membrane biosynthesis protein TonB
VARVRLLWVPLLLAPAGVVFVATRTAIDPIASAERIDVVPHFPIAIALPTAAIGITTPGRHVTVRVHTRRPVAKRPKTRIAHAPRPVYVVPKTVIARVVPAATATPHASHTAKPKPKPAPTPTPAPPTTTTPEPTPPAQPPEPPTQPTPTPAAPPSPAPTPPAPTPAQTDGDGDDDQPESTGDTRPGNGWGDQNHDHTGPPGHSGDHSHD